MEILSALTGVAGRKCLAAALYDPATAGTFATTALLAMTAIDTTNLRLTFTAPASGKILVRMRCAVSGQSVAGPDLLFGVMSGSTVVGRVAATPNTEPNNTGNFWNYTADFVVPGLTVGQSYTLDAACGVEFGRSSTGLAWGGPNNTTGSDAYGAFQFEIWEA